MLTVQPAAAPRATSRQVSVVCLAHHQPWAATGAGQILTGNAGNAYTEGLKLKVAVENGTAALVTAGPGHAQLPDRRQRQLVSQPRAPRPTGWARRPPALRPRREAWRYIHVHATGRRTPSRSSTRRSARYPRCASSSAPSRRTFSRAISTRWVLPRRPAGVREHHPRHRHGSRGRGIHPNNIMMRLRPCGAGQPAAAANARVW